MNHEQRTITIDQSAANKKWWAREKTGTFFGLGDGRCTRRPSLSGEKIRQLVKRLPESERYLLRDQMSRAADSICLNIAEGSNKLSDIEFSKYLNTSETSLEEVVCCLDLVLDDGHIIEHEFEEYLKEAEDLGAQLIAFGKKVRKQGIRI